MTQPITETQLVNLAEAFGSSQKTETFYKGHKIVIEELGDTYDYEIFDGRDPVKADFDFETEGEAELAAKSWIDNYDGPGDDYYAQ